LNSELTFRATNITLIKSNVEREYDVPNLPAQGHVNINLPRQVFNEGTTNVQLSVEYNLQLSTAAEDGTNKQIGRVSTTFEIELVSSLPITQEMADSGVLDPVRDIAVAYAHPYHRLQIMTITSGLFPQPVTLPVSMDELISTEE
jgi:hypothetical protein